jgi:hypothetical protein
VVLYYRLLHFSQPALTGWRFGIPRKMIEKKHKVECGVQNTTVISGGALLWAKIEISERKQKEFGRERMDK